MALGSTERRIHTRLCYPLNFQFVDASETKQKPQKGLLQDLSIGGLQVLSSQLLPLRRQLEVYVPLQNQELIPALATVLWTQVEFFLADSPYWLRGGLEMNYFNPIHQRRVEEFVQTKIKSVKNA